MKNTTTDNMGLLKQYFHEYLTSEDYDNMTDDEYELWLVNYEITKEEYFQAIGDGIN